MSSVHVETVLARVDSRSAMNFWAVSRFKVSVSDAATGVKSNVRLAADLSGVRGAGNLERFHARMPTFAECSKTESRVCYMHCSIQVPLPHLS